MKPGDPLRPAWQALAKLMSRDVRYASDVERVALEQVALILENGGTTTAAQDHAVVWAAQRFTYINSNYGTANTFDDKKGWVN
jgi:hypothetical protein